MFGEGKSMRTRKQGFGEWKEFGVVLFSSIVNAIVSKGLRDDREGYERARIKKEIELLEKKLSDIQFLVFMMATKGIEETKAYLEQRMQEFPALKEQFDRITKTTER